MNAVAVSATGFSNFLSPRYQEGVCATFAASVSSACVVDIGARQTTVTCIEDGLVYQDSRMALDFGGDDVTYFLHALLVRLAFPYKGADLSRWHDFVVLENLKERLVVLGEVSQTSRLDFLAS